MEFALYFLVFGIGLPIFYFCQYLDSKKEKEQLQRKIDKAAIRGNIEETQFYIDRLTKMK